MYCFLRYPVEFLVSNTVIVVDSCLPLKEIYPKRHNLPILHMYTINQGAFFTQTGAG